MQEAHLGVHFVVLVGIRPQQPSVPLLVDEEVGVVHLYTKIAQLMQLSRISDRMPFASSSPRNRSWTGGQSLLFWVILTRAMA